MSIDTRMLLASFESDNPSGWDIIDTSVPDSDPTPILDASGCLLCGSLVGAMLAADQDGLSGVVCADAGPCHARVAWDTPGAFAAQVERVDGAVPMPACDRCGVSSLLLVKLDPSDPPVCADQVGCSDREYNRFEAGLSILEECGGSPELLARWDFIR